MVNCENNTHQLGVAVFTHSDFAPERTDRHADAAGLEVVVAATAAWSEPAVGLDLAGAAPGSPRLAGGARLEVVVAAAPGPTSLPSDDPEPLPTEFVPFDFDEAEFDFAKEADALEPAPFAHYDLSDVAVTSDDTRVASEYSLPPRAHETSADAAPLGGGPAEIESFSFGNVGDGLF